MAPRITFSRDADNFLQIWVNAEGRDLLVRELQGLSETSDHVHFGPAYMDPELPTREIAYEAGDVVMAWGKVLFRPDAWDAQYFPHVMVEPEQPER